MNGMDPNITLVVVESPSKSKTISKYLGENYIVRPTVGHIVDLSQGRGGDIGVDIENGFKPKYADIADKKDIINSLLLSAKTASEIIIASDPDREGEAIAFHVYEKLKKLNKPIHRAEFHEITKAGIAKGISNLRSLDENLYNAQQARRVLDRIVGFMVSPYLIKKLGDKLSAGRVQSVALRLIVDREKEIKAFKPDDYWTINTYLTCINGKFTASYPGKITSEKQADIINQQLLISKYSVSNVVASEQKKKPLPPVNTAELQKAGAVKYKFSADKTIKTAQSLYEAGHVTYIRSDSYRCSDESIDNLRKYLKGKGYSIPASKNEYKNKDASQDAHEAIRPTDVSAHPDTFIGTDDQKKVYRIIWERFVASQMNPAIYDTVSIDICAESKDGNITLKSNGKTLREKGYLDIYKDTDKSKDNILPLMSAGEVLNLVSPKVKVEKKSTKPPARYNDGSIIDELKKRGIGRPSTYAAILTKISSRKYIKKVSNHFEPTETGMQVVDDLVEHFSFMNYDYTAKMEEQLDKISLGEVQYSDVMSEFYAPFITEYRRAKNSDGLETDIKCPICNDKTVVRHSQYGFFAGCIKYPECRGVMGIRFEDDKIIEQPKHEVFDKVDCPKCGEGMVRRDGKFGPFYSCSNYPRCDGKRKIPFGKKCNKCGDELYLTVFNDEPKLACMAYPNCKNVESVPDGTNPNWIPPNQVIPKELPKKIEKILKKKI